MIFCFFYGSNGTTTALILSKYVLVLVTSA
jgi:hypothetical protein